MRGNINVTLIVFVALLLRWSVTYHPHSGEGKPPMFGDYEAQRHWQEITLNLHVRSWYINSTDNDLLYWGLDYPPLTAYHSLLMGQVASKINSSYVTLYESRGISSAEHKHFMRLTVLLADVLTYIPAVIFYVLSQKIPNDQQDKENNLLGFTKTDAALFILLVYPGLIVIDHGHFQYNCVSLGLFVASVAAMLQNSFVTGSFFFVSALNYKQMELYHALPIFFYILGNCIPTQRKHWLPCLKTLASVASTVIFTFSLVWLPFLRNWTTFLSVLHRLFPFARGVFEDKVANIWCAINVIYKLRGIFTNAQLAQFCLLVTTLAVLPSCLNLYLNPSKEKLLLSLINCSTAFFLFSFQVHEKSILLAAVPVLLYFHKDPLPCFWFLLISHFSMLPLFLKDDLYFTYVSTQLLYYVIVSWVWTDIFDYTSLDRRAQSTTKQKKVHFKHVKGDSSVIAKIQKIFLFYCNSNATAALLGRNKSFWHLALFYSSLLGTVVLSIVSGFVKPPEKYPDLFALLVSVYSCGHFIMFYLYFSYKQFCIPKNYVNKSKLR